MLPALIHRYVTCFRYVHPLKVISLVIIVITLETRYLISFPGFTRPFFPFDPPPPPLTTHSPALHLGSGPPRSDRELSKEKRSFSQRPFPFFAHASLRGQWRSVIPSLPLERQRNTRAAPVDTQPSQTLFPSLCGPSCLFFLYYYFPMNFQ